MSSRTLRKLQREQEEKNQLDALKEDNVPDDDSEEEAPAGKVLNAFDMLNEGQDEDEASDFDVEDPNDEEKGEVSAKIPQVEASEKPKSKTKSNHKKS